MRSRRGLLRLTRKEEEGLSRLWFLEIEVSPKCQSVRLLAWSVLKTRKKRWLWKSSSTRSSVVFPESRSSIQKLQQNLSLSSLLSRKMFSTTTTDIFSHSLNIFPKEWGSKFMLKNSGNLDQMGWSSILKWRKAMINFAGKKIFHAQRESSS